MPKPMALRSRTTVLAVAVAAVGLSLAAPQARADAVVHDGASAATAAASCYEVKQVNPSAPSGAYWLQTPTLVTPQQFYCDQVTDGGGWVMIGRGRENWNFLYTGQGTADTLATTPSGTAAFTPVALPSTTVDGLLNGGRPDALPDGVRLVRSKTTDGASTQEVRFKFAGRDRWTWTMGASHPLGPWSMTGTGTTGTTTATGTSGSSSNFGTDQIWSRVGTAGTSAESYKSGFAFGTSATGSTAATSYVWKSATAGARAVPFTQVFLRPTLMSSNLSYAAIPDSGTPAQALRSMPELNVQTNPWGVGGTADGNDGVNDTEVRAIAQVGDRMIVGGNFAYVQQDESGTGRVNQSYLAAFDVNTGQWLPDFRPTFDNQVQRIVALPNGEIVVGGDFSTVNGAASPGIVALNPTTGAISTSFRVSLQQQLSAQPLYVRGLELRGNQLYIGGNFTHLSGGTQNYLSYSRSLARVSAVNGTPDNTWRPEVQGNVNAVKASADGTRVYVVGNYTKIQNDTTAPYFTALSAAAGAAVIPGQAPQFSSPGGKKYQQAVTEAAGKVWEGGSEHMMFQYDAATMGLVSTSIAYNKGDFQVLTEHDGVVYGSCHCPQWLYSGAKTWPSVGNSWTEADSLEYVGAWDAATGAYIPTFVPDGVTSRDELGGWAITFDSNGTMWVGGDFVSARGTAGTRVWTGGFMRYAAQDTTPPTTPTAPRTAVRSSTVLRVGWTLSTDNSSKPIRYEVLADDRVIANVGGNIADVPMPTSTTRYFVRAVDKAGNRSASTAAITFTP